VSSEAIGGSTRTYGYTSREQVKSDTVGGSTTSYGYERPAIRPPSARTPRRSTRPATVLVRGGSHSVQLCHTPTGATGYTFNPSGDRTATTPAITYGYDQTSRLTSYNRPDRVGHLRLQRRRPADDQDRRWQHGDIRVDNGVHTNILSGRHEHLPVRPDGLPIEQTGPAARSGSCTTRWARRWPCSTRRPGRRHVHIQPVRTEGQWLRDDITPR